MSSPAVEDLLRLHCSTQGSFLGKQIMNVFISANHCSCNHLNNISNHAYNILRGFQVHATRVSSMTTAGGSSPLLARLTELFTKDPLM